MANLSKMTDAQLKSQLRKLKKIVARTSNDVAKAKMQGGIDNINEELAKRKEPKAESKPKEKPKENNTKGVKFIFFFSSNSFNDAPEIKEI